MTVDCPELGPFGVARPWAQASLAETTPDEDAEQPLLAAVRVADDAAVETLMATIVDELRSTGCRLAGFVQRSVDREDGGGSHLVLVDLRDGSERPLSAPRGKALDDAHRACTVDDTVLAGFAAQAARDLESGIDLLILNRFGRREAEGRGCRDELAAALDRDTPALCVVRESHVEDWQAFGGDLVCLVAPDPAAVGAWYRRCRRAARGGCRDRGDIGRSAARSR